MANPIRGADGTVFQVTIVRKGKAIDISAATVKKLIFFKSDGTVLNKAASFTDLGGTDGKLEAPLSDSELNVGEVWEITADLDIGTYSGQIEKARFLVEEPLEA